MESAARVRQELVDCNAVLEDIVGVPVRFFRPPFGARRPVVLRIARELGLTPVMWNVTGYDWNQIGAEAILDKLRCRRMARNQEAAGGRRICCCTMAGTSGMGAPRMGTGAGRWMRLVTRLECRHGLTQFVAVDAVG